MLEILKFSLSYIFFLLHIVIVCTALQGPNVAKKKKKIPGPLTYVCVCQTSSRLCMCEAFGRLIKT